jgi:hypothetical protein
MDEAWFIVRDDQPVDLAVALPGRVIRFKHAEYRTRDEMEIAALDADPRVRRAGIGAATLRQVTRIQSQTGQHAIGSVVLQRYVVNVGAGVLHDAEVGDARCHIPDDLDAAGWKAYRRSSDAQRWNRQAKRCPFCMPEARGV